MPRAYGSTRANANSPSAIPNPIARWSARSDACGSGSPSVGVESLDRLHQVERGAEQLDIGTRGDQRRVGNVGSGERGQHPRFAPHGLVAVRPLVGRWPPEHELASAAREPDQHVLGAAADRTQVRQWTRLEVVVVHPRGEPIDVDKVWSDGFRSDRFGHGRAISRARSSVTPVNDSDTVQSRRATSSSCDRLVELTSLGCPRCSMNPSGP